MSKPQLSVIIPIQERGEELVQTNSDYLAALQGMGEAFELIYVVDRDVPKAAEIVDATVQAHTFARSIKLSKYFGDATALSVGLDAAAADKILVLPAYPQILASEIPKVVAQLDQHDVVVSQRNRDQDSGLNRLQAGAFNFLARRIANLNVEDMTGEVKALTKEVANEVELYGDMHRFLPHLAHRLGFRVGGVKVEQAPSDRKTKMYAPGVYSRRLLDILTALFLLRFTKKPLRFFGLIGLTTIVIGALVLAWVIIDRLWFGAGLSDRPALFLGSLIIALGLQILAVGLVGEIIIFSRGKDQVEYRIGEVAEVKPELDESALGEPQQMNGR